MAANVSLVSVVALCLLSLFIMYDLYHVRTFTAYAAFDKFKTSMTMFAEPKWPPLIQHINTNVTSCRVKLMTRSTPMRAQLPLCTSHVYRERSKAEDYFPSTGNWVPTTSKKLPYTFAPDFCRFSPDYTKITKSVSVIRNCVARKRVARVVLMGDSHGARTFDALLALLKGHGFRCALLRSERENKSNIFQVDKAYFNTTHLNSAVIQTGSRACATCRSRLYNCVSGGVSFEAELLAFNYILDTTMTVQQPHSRRYPAASTQELLLRYYLKGRMPDLVIIHVPFLHAIHRARDNYLKVHADLQYFRALLRMYLPLGTDVFWIPAPRLYPNAQILRENRFPTWEGLTFLEHLNMDNVALYDVIKDDLVADRSRWMSYFNSFELTCPLGRHTDQSGVHFSPFYYQTIMAQMWQLVCENA